MIVEAEWKTGSSLYLDDFEATSGQKCLDLEMEYVVSKTPDLNRQYLAHNLPVRPVFV